MKTAVFPGSFDPITLGHIDIIIRSLKLFDNVIIAIGINHDKKYKFSLKKRKEFISSIFQKEKKIIIQEYQGLTVNFCYEQKIKFIIRGLRNDSDFDYEKDIALTNKKLHDSIETVFFLTNQEHIMISSSLVKDIINNKGNLAPFLHESTIKSIENTI
ncbi:MAG: pantetheine-phosphate adenylyltransferase [Flavobacteriales bacterium TMED191]|nr:MAG: pantetheine-phosphate adenylyltransferase [Flavobacteriales bacterium TMED191]|tara:strand:+ start:1744 stop:2217 length:474 start_codon:yes stop_codon:yes gene_type:complete